MKSLKITTNLLEFGSIKELEATDAHLVTAAKNACYNAYAPYSGFKVGVAVRLENGIIVLGTNVENAAFPSGICAERSALSAIASNYPDIKPETMAIAAINKNGFTDEPVPPCGNCRQVIAEEIFRNNKPLRLILAGNAKIYIIENGSDLLPLQFNNLNL